MYNNCTFDIIIGNASIERIDEENVSVNINGSVIDDKNDNIPGVELDLMINGKNMAKIISNPLGLIKVNKTLKIYESEIITIQILEISSNVKSKIKKILDSGNDNNNQKFEPPKTEIKDNQKENIIDDELLDEYEKAMKAIKINPAIFGLDIYKKFWNNKKFVLEAIRGKSDNYNYLNSGFKEDDEIVTLAINTNVDVVDYFDIAIALRENVLKVLRNFPQKMARYIAGKINNNYSGSYSTNVSSITHYIKIDGNINYIYNNCSLISEILKKENPNKEILQLILEHPKIIIEGENIINKLINLGMKQYINKDLLEKFEKEKAEKERLKKQEEERIQKEKSEKERLKKQEEERIQKEKSEKERIIKEEKDKTTRLDNIRTGLYYIFNYNTDSLININLFKTHAFKNNIFNNLDSVIKQNSITMNDFNNTTLGSEIFGRLVFNSKDNFSLELLEKFLGLGLDVNTQLYSGNNYIYSKEGAKFIAYSYLEKAQYEILYGYNNNKNRWRNIMNLLKRYHATSTIKLNFFQKILLEF